MSGSSVAWWFALATLLGLPFALPAADLSSLISDRAAIERIYYNHRLGDKPPFEQTLPREALNRLVRADLHKEAVLKKAYGIEVSAAIIEAEVQRINTTTRSPETLAELKAALGNDTVRFARIVAKPIVVEHLLRERFDNDDALHAPQRRIVEMIRGKLLKARSSRGDEAPTSNGERGSRKAEPDSQSLLTSAATNGVVEKLVAILKRSHSNAVTETTWQLGARPAETNAPTADEIEIKKCFGPNAQILSSPHAGGKDQKFYFEDMPEELQNVLRVQLRQAGDVSAVIETPGGFLLYVAKERTDAVLSVAGLSLPKRSYEQWLEEQSENKP